ncbi:MAG: leucine-rich repeat protein, partial [Eggerthellaceae bacterium]|nr:leucine-rich repeat protein [Eggerthellaceae bacterium]
MSRACFVSRFLSILVFLVLAVSMAPIAWAVETDGELEHGFAPEVVQASLPKDGSADSELLSLVRSPSEPQGTIFESDDAVSLSDLIDALPAYEASWELPYYYQQLDSAERALYLKMKYEIGKDGIIELNDIGEYSFEQIDPMLGYAFRALECEYPWFSVYSSYYSLSGNDSSCTIELGQNLSYAYKIDKSRAALDALVNACRQGQNRFEQLFLYVSFLHEHVPYDYDVYFLSNTYWDNTYHSPGVLLEHLAVCDGVAKTTKALCDELDIPCVYINSVSPVYGSHAWNYIQMEDGIWYSFDGTNFQYTEVDDDFEIEGFENGLRDGEMLEGSFHSSQDPRHEDVCLLGLEFMTLPTLSDSDYVYSGPVRELSHYDGTFDYDEGEAVFTYSVNPDGETCTITGYEGPQSGDLVIPTKIDGLTVTAIGEAAFYRCKGFTGRLVIPDTVESIGACAFFECDGFTGELDLSNNLVYINQTAFAYCTGFTGSISFPDKVVSIGESAFYGCTGISGDLNLPDSLQVLGDYAFEYCSGLDGTLVIPSQLTLPEKGCIGDTNFRAIEVRGDNPNYRVYDGILYSQDGTVLLLCPPKKQGAFTILDTTEVISQQAFAYCDELTGKLELPAGLKRIEYRAFYECVLSGELQLPDGLEYIGQEAFSFSFASTDTKRTGLTGDLIIPDSVTEIGSSAFLGNDFGGILVLSKNLTRIEDAFTYCTFSGQLEIPEGVEEIADWAFSFGSSDRPMFFEPQGELVLPKNLKKIGEHAFRGYGMTGTLVIPASVISIGDYAFECCTSLEAFDVDPDNEDFSACEGVLMSKDQSVLVAYPNAKGISSYTIPDTVTTIGGGSFYGNTTLSIIIVPDSVTSVGQEAFCCLAYGSEIYVPNEEIMRLVEEQSWPDWTNVYI